MKETPIYDNIGIGYNQTRKADLGIVKEIIIYLNSKQMDDEKYLDIGCGTGNYTAGINSNGINIFGIDQSQVMIAEAQRKYPNLNWHLGSGENLVFKNNFFNGITIVNALQYFNNWHLVFNEAYRVISQGRIVIFTPTQEQLNNYWLNHYFPVMMKKAIEQMPKTNEISHQLVKTGFNKPEYFPYFITENLEDLFLYCGKNRPLVYFDPLVTNNIGAFSLFASPFELRSGLNKLKDDLKSGKFQDVISKYNSTNGDCSFIVANKN